MENKKPEDLKQDLTAPAELDDELLMQVAAGTSKNDSEDESEGGFGDLLKPYVPKR